MKIKLYNTFSKKIEIFKPLKSDYIRQYDCGPTVYSYAHIGNMWRYIGSDILRRVLEYNGYKVKQVMNITDVGHLTENDLVNKLGEDKIEKAAKKEKKTPRQIAHFYTKVFFEDTKKLNILRPSVIPRASQHISEMIDLIKILEKKGYTYSINNKYLLYNVLKFKNYGKLSGKKLSELKVGARLEPLPGKKSPFDFALWISDPKHLMRWRSPWGIGYPGWHIECSAMSMKYLGPTLDIHTGGEDNIFPHHENEIAQSEAATGKKFVRYWIHIRHNLVNGEKMSKSKGNFYTLSDLIKKGFNPLSYRYLSLTTHYRTNLNFTWEGLKSAENALNKLQNKISQFKSEKIKDKKINKVKNNQYQKLFLKSINNDLDTAGALAVAWKVVKDKDISANDKYNLLVDFDKVFGLGLEKIKKEKIPLKIKKMVQEREKLRKNRNFQKADEIRKEILKLGYKLEDSKNGVNIEKNYGSKK